MGSEDIGPHYFCVALENRQEPVQPEQYRAYPSTSADLRFSFLSETLKYWVGVQWGQLYRMGRRCLFSLGWRPF